MTINKEIKLKTSIAITIGEQKIELNENEARELYFKLNKIFGWNKTYTPITHPIFPDKSPIITYTGGTGDKIK